MKQKYLSPAFEWQKSTEEDLLTTSNEEFETNFEYDSDGWLD
jgi:hypothetical protein